MANILDQPREEQVLYWLFHHLDLDTPGPTAPAPKSNIQDDEPRPADLNIRRSRRSPAGKDDDTLVNITPQSTRPDDGTVNAGWTTTGRSMQRWEMEVEISVARAKWPVDSVYGTGDRQGTGFAPESSVAEVVKWIQARLRPNYFENDVGYPATISGTGTTATAITDGEIKGNLISDVSLDEIRWAFADRDQGEVVALMRYRIEYHLG